MTALYLNEDEVLDCLDMPSAIVSVEEAFRQWGVGKAENVPRRRARAPGIWLHSLSASAEYLGVVGWKNYTTTREAARFHIMLYDAATGSMLAFLEADWLGRYRTGATSGVATKYLAREDAKTVGIFGTGKQAQTQLQAICHVREIERVSVSARNTERSAEFAREMSAALGIEVTPAVSAEEAVREKDIIVTATSSGEALFSGEAIAAGTHLNLIGSNHLRRTEIDMKTVMRAHRIVCDSIDQCRLEAGDFSEALAEGVFDYSETVELRNVISGEATGRTSPLDVTLFKSVGLGLEDVAVAKLVLDRARERGLGTGLPF